MEINSDKKALFDRTRQQLLRQGFRIDREDLARPWGGFFVLAESQAQQFADEYFYGLAVDELRIPAS